MSIRNFPIAGRWWLFVAKALSGIGFLFLSILAAAQSSQSDLLRAKAEHLFEEKLYSEAKIFYEKAYETAMPEDPIRGANLCVDISTIYHLKGDFVKGKLTCKKGLSLVKNLSQVPDSILYKLHASLGLMFHGLYLHDSAHYHFQESLSIYHKNPDLALQIPDYVAFGLNNYAMLFLLENNFGKAEVLLEQAIGVYQARNDMTQMAVLMNSFAGFLDKTGSFEKAIEKRRQAISLVKKDHPQLPSMLLGLAWDYFETKEVGKAQETLERTLILTIDNPLARAKVYYGLAQCYLVAQNLSQTEILLSKGISTLQNHDIHKGKLNAELYLGFARVYEYRKNYKKSLEYIQLGLISAHSAFTSQSVASNPEFEGTLSEVTAFQLLWHKGLVFKKLYEQDSTTDALKNGLLAYTSLITFRNKMLIRLDRLETRTFVTEKQFELFEETLEICYQLWNKTNNPWYQSVFFSALENSRASALSIGLLDLRIKPTTLPDSLMDLEKKLQQKIAREKSRIISAGNPEADSKLKNMEFELVQLQNIYQKLYPVYYKAHYEHERINLDHLQQLLDPEQTYLDYFTGNRALYAICITKSEVKIVRIDINVPLLYKKITSLCSHLYTDPGMGLYEGSAEGMSLYKSLLGPFSKSLRKKLLIARSGILNKLPFEVLQAGPNSSDCLIQSKRISYVNAASTHFINITKSVSKAPWLIVTPFSNPVPGSSLPALKEISLTLSPQSGDKILSGSQASKKQFLSLSGNYRVLHLSTHAIATDNIRDKSYVAFFPEKNHGHELHAAEILQMDLPATQMVILAACQGGFGAITRGEGIQSLAYSFTYAGCPSVISTIWAANDATTAFLTSRFARYSREGYELDEALFKARSDYFNSEIGQKYDHPFYWANLVLWGQSTPITTGNPNPLWLLTLLPAMILIGTLFWKRIKTYHFFN